MIRVISTTNASEAEIQIQRAIDDAATLGKTLQELKFSTCPAVISSSLRAFDPPEERTACWYNILLIFSD